MKKRIILLWAIISLLAAGCTQVIESKNPLEVKDQNTVVIKGFAFSPTEIKIQPGSSVTWLNEDSAPHTIEVDGITSAKIASGDRFGYTFANPGEYSYICGLHPSMKGKVIVQ